MNKIPVNCAERITNTIVELVFKDSFWGYLFSKLDRKEDKTIPSLMGVSPEMDGTIALLYNPNFINLADDDFIRACLEHEGIHVLNNHIPRLLRIISDEVTEKAKDQKAKKWNVAADCAVNTLINIKRSYLLDGKIPFELHFPDLYKLPDRKTAEFYYEHLPEQKGKGSGSGSGKGSGSDESAEKHNIDDHGSWTKNASKVSDIGSLASRIENYTDSMIEETYNSVRRKGNLPSFISERMNEILKPPHIPYYQIIAKLVKGSRLSKQKRAYTRINKKRIYSFFLDENHLPLISPFPGKTKDFSFNISILLDTSGSMEKDEILEGLSAVKNIIENDKDCHTTVIECDTVIHKEYEVKRLRDIDYTIRGRGGTELFPALSRCKELKSDVTIVFTDGFTDNINRINRASIPRKIIYALTSDGSTSCIDETGYIVRLPGTSKRSWGYR